MRLLLAEPIIMQADSAQSLDQLWHEAAQLGQIAVDMDYKGTTYDVTIKFARKSGTRIYAKGQNTNIAFAVAAAINEAREMGAGRTE
jgi:hypothetical protein